MSDFVKSVEDDDIGTFSNLYEKMYKNLYYTAYYALAGQKDAVEAVKYAVRTAFEKIHICKTEGEAKTLILKLLCEKIIAFFREYKQRPEQEDENCTPAKSMMKRLTDAERISVSLNTIYGFDAKKIAYITGLSESVISKKLESGKEKLDVDLN